MRSFIGRFVDLETDPAGFGDPAGDPSAFTAIEDPGAQPDPAVQAVPDSGPEYISRADLEQILAERDAQLAYQQQYDPYQQQQAFDPYQAQPQQPVGPHLDPFDDGFGQSLQQLIRDELAAAQAPMQQMLSPIAQSYQDQQAQAWAEQAFNQLGVPDDRAWRDAVIAASAGYERDQFGRPVPPHVALRNGYELVKGLAEAERQKALAEQQQTAAQTQQHLQAVAAAPSVPAGSGTAVEAEAQPRSMVEAVRAAAERVTAGQSGTAA